MKVNTYLPIFSGFYNTIWEYNDDYVLESVNDNRKIYNLKPIGVEHLSINYKAYRKCKEKYIAHT